MYAAKYSYCSDNSASFLWFSLSGYGFMDIGLPPASPSDKDIDLKVYGFYIFYLLISILL